MDSAHSPGLGVIVGVTDGVGVELANWVGVKVGVGVGLAN